MQDQNRDRSERPENLPKWAEPRVKEYREKDDILVRREGGPPCSSPPCGRDECAKDPDCNPANIPIDGGIFQLILILSGVILGVYTLSLNFKEGS